MTSAPQRTEPDGDERWLALRAALSWVAHPVTLAAVMVLVANDHILKRAHGTWWTGKLSDAAGLVFFPALLAIAFAAVAPRVPFRSLAVASIAATGAGFLWVKATWMGAAAASAVWSAVVGPSVVLRDPTDLFTLPLLVVAATVALRAGASRRAIAATVALPLAVLATAATSAPLSPSAAALAATDNGPLLVVEGGGYYGYDPVYRLQLDGTWVEISSTSEDDDFAGRVKATTVSCTDDDPAVCFRPRIGRIGVDRSIDGGQTWRVDWELSDEQQTMLADVYDVGDRQPHALTTNGVAVVPTSQGFRVIAANGFDGIAVRDEDGHWTRKGWEGLDCCEAVRVADLERGSQPWRAQEMLAWPVTWSIVAFGLAFMGVMAASPRSRRRSVWRVIGGGVLVVLGLGWTSLTVLVNASPASRVQDSDLDGIMMAFGLGVGLLFTFAGASSLIRSGSRGFSFAFVSALAVAIGVGIASTVAPDRALAEGFAATVTLGAGVSAAVWVERRWVARRPSEVQDEQAGS